MFEHLPGHGIQLVWNVGMHIVTQHDDAATAFPMVIFLDVCLQCLKHVTVMGCVYFVVMRFEVPLLLFGWILQLLHYF